MNKRTLQILAQCKLLENDDASNIPSTSLEYERHKNDKSVTAANFITTSQLDYELVKLEALTPNKYVSEVPSESQSSFYMELTALTGDLLNHTLNDPMNSLVDEAPSESSDSLQDPDYVFSGSSGQEDDETYGKRVTYPVTADFENVQIESEDRNLEDEIQSENKPDKNQNKNTETTLKQNEQIDLEADIGKRKVGGRQKKPEEERTRKRIRNEKSWKENVRKNLKEEGQEYVTKKGIVKKRKEIKKPCKCRLKCYEKVNEKQRRRLFDDYYKLSRDGQDQYIAETIKENKKERERIRTSTKNPHEVSRRQFTRKYFLKNEAKQSTEVCQNMYLNTYDITVKKVRVIVEKKRVSESNICPKDRRGRHSKHMRIGEERKDVIRKHITSFPNYTSHYSRERTSKKYLSPDLSIALMYQLYCKYCKQNKIKWEKESQYRKIFNEEFNLSFHAPANDTCAKCDRLRLSLRALEDKQLSAEEEENKAKLLDERKVHLNLAESAYKQKSLEKEISKKNQSFITASFDLEKCLPTPYLRNGVSFYKRQLWTYNLTVYETTTSGSVGVCFLWNETIAGRGGQEIASCIRRFILSLPNEVEVLNFYSDSCSGQNRNIFMCTMFCFVLDELRKSGRILREIHHKFMEPGHSHMEADTIHAAIETRKRKTTAEIEVPHDWSNFIRTVRRNPPLQVVEMQQQDFLNFKSLLTGKLVHRKQNEEGAIVPWMRIKWIKVTQENPYQLFYKTSLTNEEIFKKIDLRRGTIRNRENEIDIHCPKQINFESLPLADLKVSNLLDLLPYISEYNKPFYQNLQRSEELDAEDIPDVNTKELSFLCC